MSNSSNSAPPASSAPPQYLGCTLRWPVERSGRSLRVYVVEPIEIKLATSDLLFAGILQSFIVPQLTDVGGSVRSASRPPEPFDLMTFPEAFTSPQALITVLRSVRRLGAIGCVHVGLHSALDEKSHLFPVDEIRQLLDEIRGIPEIEADDLREFDAWLSKQKTGDRFNIGCLFAVDARRRVRVCLHPKMVPSQYEYSGFEEKHMAEGNLLSVVTLEPQDSRYTTINIQPLLCSDVLPLPTNVPMRRPLLGINVGALTAASRAPDHIDIVSVATCTPQQSLAKEPGGRQWHEKWRSAFLSASEQLQKHRTSIFVLSNYAQFPGGRPGGLSGAYVPRPLGGSAPFPHFVFAHAYQQDPDGQMMWLPVHEEAPSGKHPRNDCYIAALRPSKQMGNSPAQALGFTITAIVRDLPMLPSDSVLVQAQLYSSDDKGKLLQERTST